MKNIAIIFAFTFATCSCQDLGKLEFVADLPGLVNEVSGIEKFDGEEMVWLINDSRNPPEIYGFDLITNKIAKTLRLKNASNIDWEDLAKGPDGTLYVGDFGNNMSLRTDLTIYAIKNPGASEKRRTEAVVTTFRYPDQENFPPKKKDISFDVEAFVFLNDYFYLFTRNRAKKYDGTTTIYTVPAREGDFVATRVGSLKTCDDQKDCEITGAAIHDASGKIALLSYNKVWIVSNYPEDNFTNATVKKIKLGHTSQKESICFVSENELYIADERSHGSGRNLYSLKLDEKESP